MSLNAVILEARQAAASASAGMATVMTMADRSGAMARRGIGGASMPAMIARRMAGVRRSSGSSACPDQSPPAP